VEVLAAEVQAVLGRVPNTALPDIQGAPVPTAEWVTELERDRDHEILSFLAAFCEGMPPDSARWVHLGMTSYDLSLDRPAPPAHSHRGPTARPAPGRACPPCGGASPHLASPPNGGAAGRL
jgi:hypothetical protein